MQTKLTLRLDSSLIRLAKEYAQRSGKSVSSVVADYFASLGARGKSRRLPTPKVHALIGILRASGKSLDEGEYRKHLAAKHK